MHKLLRLLLLFRYQSQNVVHNLYYQNYTIMAYPVNLTYLAMSRAVREPVSKIMHSTQGKKTEVSLRPLWWCE